MANADPYELLGVAKNATQQDIQKAFRQLAKQYHPDLNPGDKDAQSKFQEFSAAYDILRPRVQACAVQFRVKSTRPETSSRNAGIIAILHRLAPGLSATKTPKVLPISAKPTTFSPLTFRATAAGGFTCAAMTCAIVSRWTFSTP